MVSTPAKAVRAIDHRLQTFTQRNLEVPINQLPDDVLWNIFEVLAGVRTSKLTSPEDNAYSVARNEWLRALLVCRHWRDVALADPFLWNTIKCDPCRDRVYRLPGDQYISKWLARARGAPLDIYIRDMEQVSEPVLQQLSARTANFRSLRVSTVNHYQQLAVFFQEAAPILESLHIRREKHPNAPAQGDLPLLFGGNVPSLRYLSLNDVRKLGGNDFKALTYLHISNQRYEALPNEGAGMPDLLALLRASPTLESCVFKNCTADVTNFDPANFGLPTIHVTPAERVDLRLVKRLVLDVCDASFTMHILHRVVLADPVAMFVDNRAPFPLLPPRATSGLGPILDATSYRIKFTPPDRRFYEDEYDQNKPPVAIDVIAMTPTSAVLLRLWQAEGRWGELDFPQGFVPPEQDGIVGWTEHLDETPFHGVEELWLGGKPLGNSHEWHAHFSAMPALRRLVLDFTASDARERRNRWLLALSTGIGPLCAPTLRELECHALPMSQGAVDMLLRVVQDRDRSGHRLRLLRVLPRIDADRRDPFERIAGKGVQTVDDWEARKADLRLHVDDFQEDGALRVPPPQLPEVCGQCAEFQTRPYA